jgi:hypothetical protein
MLMGLHPPPPWPANGELRTANENEDEGRLCSELQTPNPPTLRTDAAGIETIVWENHHVLPIDPAFRLVPGFDGPGKSD